MTQSPLTQEPRAAERKKHGAVAVIGLTGGIGGGKSSVAALLKERGALVIDADAVGHELLSDPRVQSQIAERFGRGVFSRNGAARGEPSSVDRKALGAIVFADRRALADLEAILHPKMRERFQRLIDQEASADSDGRRRVVLDAAILLEAGWDDLCDWIVYVDAPRDERMRRVDRERGWSQCAFEAREAAQWPCDRKRQRADFIIANDAGVDGLTQQVERLETRLAELSFL